MKHKIMPLNWLMLILFLLPISSWGQKLGATFGFYDIRAESQGSNGATQSLALQRPGAYQLTAQFRLLDPLEIGVGYSLFYSRIIGGDMGFGPDISLIYFPFAAGGIQSWNEFGHSLKLQETLRPFIAGSFHQRQFQSVQTSYSGFGLQIGLEWNQNAKWGYLAKLSTQSLTGPNSLGFQFLDLSLGFQLYMD